MKFNKFFIIAMILLVSLLCVSAVSAADAVSDVVADTNDVTVLEESIDDANLKDSQSDENVLKDDPEPPHYEPDFTDLEEKILNADNTVELTSDFNNTEDNYNDGNGIIINHDLTINGNGHTIDGNNKGRIFNVQPGAVVTFNDITFVNANPGTWSYGGAISNDGQAKANNCTFIDNKAYYGSAVAHVDCENCIFINNSADYYGTMFMGTAINCQFIDNYADSSAAGIDQGTAINCTFINNHLYEGDDHGLGRGAAMTNSTAINCSFIGNVAKNEGGAIYKSDATNCTFINNSAKNGGASYLSNATNCVFTCNNAEIGGAMYQGKATNCTFQLNTAAEDIDMHDVSYDIYRTVVPAFSASDLNTYYNYGDKFNFTITGEQVLDGVNATILIYKDGALVANYSALSGQGWTVDLPVGTYTAELSVPGSNVAPVNRTITVAKNPTKITAGAVTSTYNVNKYLVITLTDGKGNKISGVKVTVTLGTAKTYTTDKNGQIKINVAKLVPKTYTAKIAFAGNDTYAAVSKNVKVVVKKATPKITAKAKTFKVSVKTKKYTVTLKNNKGAVLKKVKVTLKVGKKTYKATTNSKGKATFKITKLTKKGKYTATIKYAGSKYYKALSKKVKITVK